MKKTLVAYYSRAGENYVSGQIKTLKKGNTEVAAEILAKFLHADLFKIEQKIPYSEKYNECTDEALNDQKRNVRPELSAYPKSLEQYDTIYLGYPNYWGSVPMAVCTFLEKGNFVGKTVRPFCTHEGSGLGHSLSVIRSLCPDSEVTDGLAIHGSNPLAEKEKIEQWAKEEK